MLINGRVSLGMMVRATPEESISRPSSCSKPITIGARDRRVWPGQWRPRPAVSRSGALVVILQR